MNFLSPIVGIQPVLAPFKAVQNHALERDKLCQCRTSQSHWQQARKPTRSVSGSCSIAAWLYDLSHLNYLSFLHPDSIFSAFQASSAI
eukprot:3941979-Rhodomonas_salina.1